jgi:hypothetical protein
MRQVSDDLLDSQSAMSTPKGEIRELPRPVDVQKALSEALDAVGHLIPESALIGEIALAYHGIERYTKDVDIAVTEAEAAAVAPVVAGRDPRPLKIGGISFATSSGVRVDLIDRRFEFRALFEEAIAAAKKARLRAKVDEHEVLVVPLAHMVALKLAADRPLDEADVQAILQRPDLDYAQARDIVYRHLGYFAARRLDRAARVARRKDAPPEYENGDGS